MLFRSVPEPIGVVAEWYRTKSNGYGNTGGIDADRSMATAKHQQTGLTGAGSTVLPV